MTTAFTIIYVLNCFFLLLVVLLQAGRGGGLSFTGGAPGAQTTFGAGGGAPFMQRLTVGSATLFMVLSMTLAYLSSTHSGVEAGMFVDPDEESAVEAAGSMGDSAAGDEAAPEGEAAPAGEEAAPADDEAASDDE